MFGNEFGERERKGRRSAILSPLKGMDLQADLLLPPRSRHVAISLEQHHLGELSSLFLAGRSETLFSALHFLKRQPLQEITHLFATNSNTQSIYNVSFLYISLALVSFSWLCCLNRLADKSSVSFSREEECPL